MNGNSSPRHPLFSGTMGAEGVRRATCLAKHRLRSPVPVDLFTGTLSP